MDFKNILAGVGGMCVLMIVVIVGMFSSANYSSFDQNLYITESFSDPSQISLSCGYKEKITIDGVKIFGDISFDKKANLYALGKDNISGKNKVFIIDANGNISSFGDFKDPRALYLYTENLNNYIFVSDFALGEVQVYNQNGNSWFKKKTWVAPPPETFSPTLMDFTTDSNLSPYLLVLNQANNTVAKININEMKDNKSSKAEISSFIYNSNFSNLTGITISSGKLFLANNNGVDKNTIFKYSIVNINAPTLEKFWGKQGEKEGEFNSINDISNNGSTLYVSDIGHGKIILFDFEGKFIANMQGKYNGENKYKDLSGLTYNSFQKYIYSSNSLGEIIKIGTECFYLKVGKDVLPVRSSQDFNFNIENTDGFSFNFTLDDDLDNTLPAISDAVAIAPIYDNNTITEDTVFGYDVSYKCTYENPGQNFFNKSEKIGQGNIFNLKPARSYTPSEQVGSNVYCIVYNGKFDVEVIIKKDWVPGYSENLFSFLIDTKDIANFKHEINLDDNPATPLPNTSEIKRIVSQRLYKIEETTTTGTPMSTSFTCLYYKYDQNKKDYVFSRAQRGNGKVVYISPTPNERIICTFSNCDFGGECLSTEGPVPTKDLLQE